MLTKIGKDVHSHTLAGIYLIEHGSDFSHAPLFRVAREWLTKDQTGHVDHNYTLAFDGTSRMALRGSRLDFLPPCLWANLDADYADGSTGAKYCRYAL